MTPFIWWRSGHQEDSQHTSAVGPPLQTVTHSTVLLICQAVPEPDAAHSQGLSRNRNHQSHLRVQKDLQWFEQYAASSNGVSMIEEDTRQPINIFVNACTSGCGVLCQVEAYHAVLPQHVLEEERRGKTHLQA